jgi:hypothetical protein
VAESDLLYEKDNSKGNVLVESLVLYQLSKIQSAASNKIATKKFFQQALHLTPENVPKNYLQLFFE